MLDIYLSALATLGISLAVQRKLLSRRNQKEKHDR